MELKYFAIKEEVQKQRVSIEHINTELMVSDPLTKSLPPKTFKAHANRMGLDCNPRCLLCFGLHWFVYVIRHFEISLIKFLIFPVFHFVRKTFCTYIYEIG